MDITKKQQQVLDAIERNPEAANSDAVLIAEIWSVEGFHNLYFTKTLDEVISRMTRPETITRRRRELFNMGLIKYSKEADKSREEAYINEKYKEIK